MVINFLVARRFTAIDVRRFVRHLRVAGEPALPERINERARLDPRRTGRPEPEPRILQQSPGVALAAVSNMAFGDRAVDLDAGGRDRQMVSSRGQDQRVTVEFELYP